LEAAAKIAAAINSHAELFNSPSSSSQAEIAIIVNERNFQLSHLLPAAGEHLRFSTRGWFRMLWESGYKTDFVNIEQMEKGDLSAYKLLIMPSPLCLENSAAEKLIDYVAEGGNLISEAHPGSFDENGFCIRGEMHPVMRRLFGAGHLNISTVREPEAEKRWTPEERSWGETIQAGFLEGRGEFAHKRLRANVHVQTFELEGGQPLFYWNEDIAGVLNKFGKGKAWLLGTIVGHNGNAYRDQSTWATVLSMLGQSGAVPQKLGELLLSKRIIPNKEAWFFFNPVIQTITERIPTEGWTKITDLLGAKLESENGLLSIVVKSLDVKVIILEK
jgi:hypothetical protein